MSYYDPTRMVLWVLMPLLGLNAALWGLYTRLPLMACVWFAAFVMSIGLLRRST